MVGDGQAVVAPGWTEGEAVENREQNLATLSRVEKALAQSREGGGEKYNARHLAAGKLLPRQRIELLLDRDAHFLEVCPLAGYQMRGHAPGAQHIPMGQIPARIAEIDSSAALYVVCQGGGRSQRVAQYLAQNGYAPANVSGGMLAWASSGRSVVTDDGGVGVI